MTLVTQSTICHLIPHEQIVHVRRSFVRRRFKQRRVRAIFPVSRPARRPSCRCRRGEPPSSVSKYFPWLALLWDTSLVLQSHASERCGRPPLWRPFHRTPKRLSPGRPRLSAGLRIFWVDNRKRIARSIRGRRIVPITVSRVLKLV